LRSRYYFPVAVVPLLCSAWFLARYRAIQNQYDPITGRFVPASIFQRLAEWFWSFLAGVCGELVPGYVSHLGLDALTPRLIPLLGA
jgi:hypothetical protein